LLTKNISIIKNYIRFEDLDKVLDKVKINLKLISTNLTKIKSNRDESQAKTKLIKLN